MSPISSRILPKAVSAVQAMDLKTKEQLADEIFRNQPNGWLRLWCWIGLG